MKPQQFRKKPVVIEAMQWGGTYEDAKAVVAWADRRGGAVAFFCPDGPTCAEASHHIAVHTLEGTMSALPGDWIIRGVHGEFYPCKHDIFMKTYEQVPQ